MHQPASQEGLHRAPPATPECARVRGMLRDHADGDLDAASAAQVEEHLHSCRSCAVEQARAEHEVLQLRQGFADLARNDRKTYGASLPADFARRCVERLVVSGEGLDGAERATEPAIAANGEDAVRGDVGGDSGGKADGGDAGEALRGRNDAMGGLPVALLGGVLVLMCVVVAMRWFVPDEGAPASIAQLVVIDADGTFDQARRRLQSGDRLGEQQSLWVRRGGGAKVDWHDPSKRAQPAATIQVQGGEIRLTDGSPLLVDGKLLIETNRGVSIPMADGSRVGLGVGEYVIAAIPRDMFEDEGWAPGQETWLGARNLQIDVEVLSGQPARILRGLDSAVVAVGNTASYQGGGKVSIGPSGPTLLTGGERTETPPTPSSPATVLAGQVFGPMSAPSAGADVFISYVSNQQKQTGWERSTSNGTFSVTTDSLCESDFAVVLAMPHADQVDLGVTAPIALPVHRHSGQAQLGRPIYFGRSIKLSGQVRDDDGQPRADVSVVPCVVDELFDTVLTLGMSTHTESDGTFHLTRLPSRLPSHQYLALAFSHPQLQPRVAAVVQRGSAIASPSSRTFSLPKRRSVSVVGLFPQAPFTIYEEVVGVHGGSVVQPHVGTVSPQGRIDSLMVGQGRLWLKVEFPGYSHVQELLPGTGSASISFHPDPTTVDPSARFRPLHPVDGSELLFVQSFRLQHVATKHLENAVSGRTLRVFDGGNMPLVGCELYAVSRSQCRGRLDPRFLGLTGSAGVVSLAAVKEGEDAVVIGPNGELGWLVRPSQAGPAVELTLAETGRLFLGESLRPTGNQTVMIRLVRNSSEVLSGMVPSCVRFVSQVNFWEARDIPPGQYTAYVRDQQFSVTVPAGGYDWLGN